MKHTTAEKVMLVMEAVSRELDGSIRLVMDNEEQNEFKQYRSIVGNLMGSIFTDIMTPIFRQYPDLTPIGLRQEDKKLRVK